MFSLHPIAGIPTEVCWQEYQRAVPFLKDTLLVHPNVGTIGQVEHSRTPVTRCVQKILGTTPEPIQP